MNLSDDPFQFIDIDPPELNENGHKLGCLCVDCFGDFSYATNERESGDEY